MPGRTVIRLEEPSLELGDASTKIFLCAGERKADSPAELQSFLNYLIGGEADSPFVKELDAAVQKARDHEEWRMEYMTLLMRDQEMIRKGREEGRAEGRTISFFEMVQDGICSPGIAANKLGLTLAEFEQRMLEAGYQLPQLL